MAFTFSKTSCTRLNRACSARLLVFFAQFWLCRSTIQPAPTSTAPHPSSPTSTTYPFNSASARWICQITLQHTPAASSAAPRSPWHTPRRGRRKQPREWCPAAAENPGTSCSRRLRSCATGSISAVSRDCHAWPCAWMRRRHPFFRFFYYNLT